MPTYFDRASARQGGSGARAVMRYNDIMQELADKARQLGFERAGWDALTEVVAKDTFKRVGNFMEVQDWEQYVGMLHAWATSMSFSSEFRRMTEEENLVFLELQENNGGHIVNSISLYELDDAGKIYRLHIYLQMAESYERIDPPA